MDKKTKENGFWGDDGKDILKAKPAIKDAWAPDRFITLMTDPVNGPQYPMSDCLHFTCGVNRDTAAEWLPDSLPPTDCHCFYGGLPQNILWPFLSGGGPFSALHV